MSASTETTTTTTPTTPPPPPTPTTPTSSPNMQATASGEIKKTVTYKWSEVVTRKMIDLFREERPLWDSRIKKYRNNNRLTRNDAWERIGSALGIDREECERKMNSLLAQYRRERVKMKRAKEGEAFEHHKLWPGYFWFDFLAEMDAERDRMRGPKRRKREPLKIKQEVLDMLDMDQPTSLFSLANSIHEDNGEDVNKADDSLRNGTVPMDTDDVDTDNGGDSGECDNEDSHDEVEEEEEEEEEEEYDPLIPEVIVEEMNGPHPSYALATNQAPEVKKLTLPKPIICVNKPPSTSTPPKGSMSVRTLRPILPKPGNGIASPASPSSSSSINLSSSNSGRNTSSSSATVPAPKLTASSAFFVRGGKLDGSPIVTSVPVKGAPTVFLRPILPKPSQQSQQQKQQQQLQQQQQPEPVKPTPPKPSYRSRLNFPAGITRGAPSMKRDNEDVFGEYISSKLRSVDERVRPLLQFEINRLIFEAETGTGKFKDPIAVALSSVGIVET